MDPFTIIALAGLVVSAVSGVVGYLKESGDAAAAQKIFDTAAKKYGEVTAENIARATADVLGPSKLAEIQANPKYKAAQDDVLAELKRTADAGGMTLETRTAFNDVMNHVNQQQSQLRQSALQRMQSRGQSTSGAETAMEIAGQQSGANAASEAGVHALGAARNNALNALTARGQLAGQMGQQQFAQDAQKAQAQDEINRLNWGNRLAQYGAASNAAGNQLGIAREQTQAAAAQGQRDGQVIAGVGNAVGQGASMIASDYRTPTAPKPAPSAGAPQFGGTGGNSPVPNYASFDNGIIDAWRPKDPP